MKRWRDIGQDHDPGCPVRRQRLSHVCVAAPDDGDPAMVRHQAAPFGCEEECTCVRSRGVRPDLPLDDVVLQGYWTPEEGRG